MRKFNLVTYSAEPKDIGVDNGLYQAELFLTNNKASPSFINSFYETDVNSFLTRQKEIRNLRMGSVEAKLLKKAKLTDMLVFSPFLFGIQYAVSQRFVDCLEKVGVPKEQYKLIPLKIRNVEIPYYLFFVPWIKGEDICFSRSFIYSQMDLLTKKTDEKKYIHIKDYQEYKSLKSEDPMLRFDAICIPDKYYEQQIISIQPIVDLFFSEELLLHMLENGVTNLYPHTKQIQLVSSFNR